MNVLGCCPDGYISHSMINTHQGFAVTFPVSNILSCCHQKCIHSWQTCVSIFHLEDVVTELICCQTGFPWLLLFESENWAILCEAPTMCGVIVVLHSLST